MSLKDFGLNTIIIITFPIFKNGKKEGEHTKLEREIMGKGREMNMFMLLHRFFKINVWRKRR